MTVLILGGTAEGRRLAQHLDQAGRKFVTSLAGMTRVPAKLPGDVRVGGYGSAAGFAHYLRAEKISAIVDATHPFAAAMTMRSFHVAEQLGIPYLQILRPPWEVQANDTWHFVDDESEAASIIKPPAVVFLATGRQTLQKFANLESCRLICRQIDPPDQEFPFQNGTFLIGRPPFSVEDEMATFRRHDVDWLVVKNAGGEASKTKLVAARRLQLPVIVVNRPKGPQTICVDNIDEAIAWLEQIDP